MARDESTGSLADQAAAWVPPWSRRAEPEEATGQDAPPEQSVQRIPEHQRPADAPHPTHIVASITEAFAIVRTGDPACAPA